MILRPTVSRETILVVNELNEFQFFPDQVNLNLKFAGRTEISVPYRTGLVDSG